MSKAICAGILVSLAGFVLLFYAAGQVLAILPRLESNPLFAPLVNAATGLALSMSGVLVCRKQYRRRRSLRR